MTDRIIQPAGIHTHGNIYLLHLRKAGGTSLRALLGIHCASLGREFDVTEGGSLNKEKYLVEDKWRTITCLRDPISRIKSSYKYEGRWSMKEPIRSRGTSKTFKAWVAEVSRRKRNRRLWLCVDNYYVRTLTGNYHHPIGESDLSTARLTLAEFDVILNTESLSSEETRVILKKNLGISNQVPHLIYPTIASNPVEVDQDLFDDESLNMLTELNHFDQELYDYSVSLYKRLVDSYDVK